MIDRQHDAYSDHKLMEKVELYGYPVHLGQLIKRSITSLEDHLDGLEK